MMKNVYDLAYELEKAMREQPEFVKLREASAALEADEITNKLFNQFREIQIKFQTMQMMGQEIPADEMAAAQTTLGLAQQNAKIVAFMEAEQRFSITVNDITKIIMKPAEEVYENQRQNIE